MNFHIQDEEIDAQTHVIELGGEIDLYTAPEFKERMVELIEDGKKQDRRGPLRGHLHRLHHARRAGRRRQAPAPRRAARSPWSAPTRTSPRSSRSPASTASSRSTRVATKRRVAELAGLSGRGRTKRDRGARPRRIARAVSSMVEQETLNLKVEVRVPARPISTLGARLAVSSAALVCGPQATSLAALLALRLYPVGAASGTARQPESPTSATPRDGRL